MKIRLRLSVNAVKASMAISPVVYGDTLQPVCHARQGRGARRVQPRSAHAGAARSSGNGREGPSARARVWRADNAWRCVRATSLALAVLALVLGVAPAWAQPPAAPPGEPADAPPSPAETMRLYRLVHTWVRQWSVPAQPTESELIRVPGATVVLRLNGEVIGRGTEIGGAGDPKTIWRVVAAAVAEADHRLPVENDALRDESVRQMVAQMTISLEAAGALIPIDPRSYEEADRTLAPGLDGVAVRIGERLASMSPGAMLSTNMTPRQALSAMASQAGGEATLGLIEPGELAEKHAAKFYRFKVTHLAQTGPKAEPVFLYRGARLFDTASLNQAELRALADRIAEHLLAGGWPGAEALGMVGTYEPWRDAYDPPAADPVDQLTVAYALRVYGHTPGVSAGQASTADRFVGSIMRDLKRIEPGETAPWDDVATSAAWVACGNWAPGCQTRVLGAFDITSGFAQDVPPAAKGLLALALVQLASEPGAAAAGGGGGGGLARAEAAVRRAYRETAEGELVAQMPWLGWAEQRLAVLKGDKELPSAVALRQMRALVWDHQVTLLSDSASEVLGGGPDLVGGIVFSKGAGAAGGLSAPMRPTWHSARPVAFIATMLGDPRLTDPAERPLELARLLASVRFLRQLQADEGTMWMYPKQRRALGGIRAAPWDQRMPPDASAMALLAVCGTLESLEAITRK